MKYNVVLDGPIIKKLQQLPNLDSARIIDKLEQTSENPHFFFEKLTNRSEYKLRVGNYRVIADINDSEIIILILQIGHRKKIYKS